MNLHLSDLCTRSDREYEILQQHTDACSATGKSYELRCRLPDSCSPAEAALGFCRTGNHYRLYIRPWVTYSGSNETLANLFAPHIHTFSSFHAMTTQLRCWGYALCSSANAFHLDPTCLKFCTQLEESVIGQPIATQSAAFRICAHIAKSHPVRPLSLVLHGPTGTGKTELCKAIVPALSQLSPTDPFQLIRTDLNIYTEAHSVARLIGSPPGYIGYGDQGVLDAVLANPRTVFLFDEIEKAHSDVLKILMAILDEGRCTTQHGSNGHPQELDFRRCIFLFTTNLDLSRKHKDAIGFSLPPSETTNSPSYEQKRHLLTDRFLDEDELARQALVQSGILREIAGRFTGFLPFYPLEKTHRMVITAKQIRTLGKEFGIKILSISPEIIEALTPTECFSVRSVVPILEGQLSPLFSQYDLAHGTSVHLFGSASQYKLVPAQ